jgi:uncharacterized protein (DUF433 family)
MTPEQKALLNELVWVDKERMHGEPCFRGTRVPIQTLWDHIEGGVPLEEFFIDFPSVSKDQAIQFLELAKGTVLSNIPCLSY